jgi:2-phosphosulfolactate phosphatase
MIIDVALNPAEIALLPKRDLSNTTCVVFDVLRATSSMLTALAHGAEEIHPVTTLEEAFALKKEVPGARLAGERQGEMPKGFDYGNSPLEFRNAHRAKLIWTTTNGTVALMTCEHAERVLVGALLNIAALHEELQWAEPERVLLVCAGTFEEFALEDAYAAGVLISEFPEAQLTDAARAALGTTKLFPKAIDALRAARNGQALKQKGRDAEVEWCAQVSAYNVAAFMDGPIVRRL